MDIVTLLLSVMAATVNVYGQTPATENHKSSQCFKSRGIPKVEFSCPEGSMIKISRAFHGIVSGDRTSNECVPSPGQDGTNCTYCKDDCIDDSMNLVYDWSTCMGNTSCQRTVMQSFMPDCDGGDKFSDYLQAEYQCVPRNSVIDICSNQDNQWISGGGYLMSPNYPSHYPTNKDCMCTLTTDANVKFVLSFYDLLLETKRGRCRADWLMLRQGEEKHRHCGAIMTGTKNITSRSNTLQLQFHSDANNNVTQTFQYFSRVLKGFWLYFSTTSPASMQISCRQMTPQDSQVREIMMDDSEDYPSEIIVKDKSETEMTADRDLDDNDIMDRGEVDDMNSKNVKNTKMEDNKMENEVLEKESEVSKENKIDHLEGSKDQQSGSGRAVLTSLLLIQTVVFRLFQ